MCELLSGDGLATAPSPSCQVAGSWPPCYVRTATIQTESRMRLASHRTAALAGALALSLAAGHESRAQRPDPSLIVGTDWLAKNLRDRSVVVLVIDRGDTAYRAGHVPGARLVSYTDLGVTVDGVSLELPSPDSLRNLFEAVGVSNATRVVLSGPPLMVTRAFYTLEYLGL